MTPHHTSDRWQQVDVAFWSVTLGGLLLDQITKRVIVAWLALGERFAIIPGFFDLCHVQNTAAAFGMGSDMEHRMWLYAAVTMLFVVGILAFQRWSSRDDVQLHRIAGLLFSGVLGNAIDRAEKGSVTDFLLVYVGDGSLRDTLISTVGTSYWPAFNVADSALCVGVVLLAAHMLGNEAGDDLQLD